MLCAIGVTVWSRLPTVRPSYRFRGDQGEASQRPYRRRLRRRSGRPDRRMRLARQQFRQEVRQYAHRTPEDRSLEAGHHERPARRADRELRVRRCRRASGSAVRNGGSLPYAYGLTGKFTTGTGDATVPTPASRGDVVIDEGVWADLGLQALTRCPDRGVPPSSSVPSPVWLPTGRGTVNTPRSPSSDATEDHPRGQWPCPGGGVRRGAAPYPAGQRGGSLPPHAPAALLVQVRSPSPDR